MMSLVYVFIGGGLGSLCRYGIGKIWIASSFPIGTLTANILSSILLGLLIGYNAEDLMSNSQRLLLMTGFCGGFSTFSTFSGELVTLYQSGQANIALTYLFLSIIAGLASIVLGLYLSKWFLT